MQVEVDNDLEHRLDDPKPLYPNEVGVYLIYKETILEKLTKAAGGVIVDEPDLYCKQSVLTTCVLKSEREFVEFKLEAESKLLSAEIREAIKRTLDADCGHTH